MATGRRTRTTSWASTRRPPTRRSRRPTASSRASTTPTATRATRGRGALQGDPGGQLGPLGSREAKQYDSGGGIFGSGFDPGSFRTAAARRRRFPRRLRRHHLRPIRQRRRAGPAGRPARQRASAAATSRPRSTSPSSRPWRAPRCRSPCRCPHPARPVTAPARSPGPRRMCAAAARAAEWRRSRRACSRSPSRARCAAAPAPRSTTRAPPASGAGLHAPGQALPGEHSRRRARRLAACGWPARARPAARRTGR